MGSRPRQRGYKVVAKMKLGSQGKRKPKNQGKKKPRNHITHSWESHHTLAGVLKSVREYEGVNPHTPKATPTLGDGVSEDSRNFKERL